MKIEEVKIGQRVKSLVEFYKIPKGTVGVIDELYNLGDDGGFMISWDCPVGILSKNYKQHDGRPAIQIPWIRDGIDVRTELQLLEIVD